MRSLWCIWNQLRTVYRFLGMPRFPSWRGNPIELNVLLIALFVHALVYTVYLFGGYNICFVLKFFDVIIVQCYL